jgi:hypothetical protein
LTKITDEELEKITLPKCWNCDSNMTSVRRGKDGWFYVGCIDCENKRICDEMYLQDTIEAWTDYSRKVWARRGVNV